LEKARTQLQQQQQKEGYSKTKEAAGE